MPRTATGLNTVSRKRPDGTTGYDWYHRRTGLLIGKSSDGWNKEAAVARAQEIDGESKVGPTAGTFGALATAYLGSPAYRKLAPKTQREYRAYIDLMRTDNAWEAVPIGGITRTAVVALHQQYEDRPWQGNAIVRVLRKLMNYGLHGIEMPGLTRNPVEKLELYDTQPRTQVWDQPRIDAFLEHAKPNLRLAFALLLYTVQRPGDMLKLQRPALVEREGRTWIRLQQAKTGALVDVPCHHRLLAEIRAAAETPIAAVQSKRKLPPAAANLVLSARNGEWSYRRFAHAWDLTRRAANWSIARSAIRTMGGLPSSPKARDKAKAAIRARLLDGVQRRDLRRTGVVQLAVAGATVPEIAALAGWKIDYCQGIVDTYLPRSSSVALGGVKKWEGSEGRVVNLTTISSARSPRSA